MKYRSIRAWTDLERYQLWLAFELKTPLVVMEEFFNRSVSSINKHLSVSGIRDNSPRYKSKSKLIRNIHTLDDLQKLVIECGLDKDTVGLERSSTRQWKPSSYAIEKLKSYGLTAPCPWGNLPKIDKLPIKSGIGRKGRDDFGQYVSMEVVLSYLLRLGINVSRFSQANPAGWTFVLDGKAVNDHICLMAANWERHRRKEVRYLVAGITEE